MIRLFRFIGHALELIARFLRNVFGSTPTTAAPSIFSVRPGSGWPGSMLTIDGSGFSDSLDGNSIEIAGDTALVMKASPNHLVVLAGEKTKSGLVRVTTGGVTATALQTFEVLPWPEERDLGVSGPPVFFHGPQDGTPAIGKKDMRVLVIFAGAAGSPPVNTAAEIATEMATFSQADRFWREATYKRTSFKYEAGPWVNLPLARNEYVWDHVDVGWARDRLLTLTKRWTQIVGSKAYCAHQGGGLSVADVAVPNWPAEVARLAPGWMAYHVVVKGTTAFVAAGPDGLIAVDISGATPVQIAKVTLGGSLRACDWSGNTLVAVALGGGVEVYDISNPSAPIRRSVIDAGGEWATCVRMRGIRAYVGAGLKIRIYDVGNLSAPVRIGEAPLGDFAMGVDVIGTTIVVATDGTGLAVFNDAGPAPVPVGNNQAALRLFNVRCAGTLAYAAAGSDGILIVDVANPANPVKVAIIPTGSSCYDFAPAPGLAVVALGASGVAPADLADSKKPLLGLKNFLTSTPPLGGDYDLSILRTNLKNAINSSGLLKGDALMVHALLGARIVTPSINFNDFEGFIVILQGSPGRGQSWTSNRVTHQGQAVHFPEQKGLIWLASHAAWGRKAHEMGHWFGMVDIYTHKFDDGTILSGDAEFWDMAGSHDSGPLFSGHQSDLMRLFDPSNVVRRTWDPSTGPTNEVFEIAAHDANEDAGARIHLLELKVAAGLSYWIEVRQKPGMVIFDSSIPIPAGAAGGAQPGSVLVTRVQEETAASNSFERPTMLFGVLNTGQSAVDAARLLRIEADSVVQTNPLVYRVIVHWNEEPPPDPNGKFDLRITPWSEKTWETTDMWINSLRNDNAAGPVYDSHEPGDDTKPTLNGDKPWVKHKNTIFARIHNSGVQAVSNVYATCYVTSPPGIGDNGSWQTLKSSMVPSMAANSETIVQFEWAPAADKHTCISVAIMPQAGEVEPRNNRAQENVANFDSGGASSHEPVVLEAEVRSPFSVWRRVDLHVKGLPIGWHAVVDKQWVWVEPKGSVPVAAVIWTDLNSPRARHDRIPDEAYARVEGWTDFATHRYIPIGGVLAKVRANKRTQIRFEAMPGQGRIFVVGSLDPPNGGVPGVVEVTDAAGAPRLVPIVTNTAGQIQAEIKVAPGRYDVQIFTSSTRAAAEAESIVRRVDVV